MTAEVDDQINWQSPQQEEKPTNKIIRKWQIYKTWNNEILLPLVIVKPKLESRNFHKNEQAQKFGNIKKRSQVIRSMVTSEDTDDGVNKVTEYISRHKVKQKLKLCTI